MRPVAPRRPNGPQQNRLLPRRMMSAGQSSAWARRDILGAEQYAAIGVEQSRVQLLGSAEFYHQAVSIKYSIERRLGKCVRLNRMFQNIHGEDAQYVFMARLVIVG